MSEVFGIPLPSPTFLTTSLYLKISLIVVMQTLELNRLP